MPEIDELLNSEMERIKSESMVNDEIVVNPTTRMMDVPISERLFGVVEDANVERKYFRCPRYVGDNIDLTKLKIYMKYVHAVGNTPEEWEDTIPQFTWCDDVKVDGNDIVWTWKLSANVFTKKGFMAFAMVAKDENTVAFNTYPAIGTVLTTIPYGSEEISTMYPDIVTQLLNRMDSVEAIATPESMQNYVNTYLNENPVQLDRTLKDKTKASPADIVGQLKEELVEISESFESINIYNPNDENVVKGTLSTTGGINESTYITTGFIPVKPNDVLYVYIVINGVFKTNSNGFYTVSLYDANRTFKSRTGSMSVHSYTVPTDVYYIRATLQYTYSIYKNVCEITKNQEVNQFTEYFFPYKIAKDDIAREKAAEANKLAKPFVNAKIIDCWGDSRTEMIANKRTSYCDYLKALLGDDYYVCNYGESSQSSGMVTARLGSNEVFVSLENNKIPSSGEVQLTEIKCTSGNNRNLYAHSNNRYIYGKLNGVYGRLTRTTIAEFTGTKFTRLSDGIEVDVKPQTKLVVDDMGSKHHACVLWFGKNDFSTALNYVQSGILDNYAKAVEYLGHDKFVILGETCSISSAYETGNNYRTILDNINLTLNSLYPNNYIDINAYLSSEQALLDVGLTITDDDRAHIDKGFPCYQLMIYSTDTSDTVHPNEKGREAIARRIYKFMQSKGWLD